MKIRQSLCSFMVSNFCKNRHKQRTLAALPNFQYEYLIIIFLVTATVSDD